MSIYKTFSHFALTLQVGNRKGRDDRNRMAMANPLPGHGRPFLDDFSDQSGYRAPGAEPAAVYCQFRCMAVLCFSKVTCRVLSSPLIKFPEIVFDRSMD